MKVNKLELQEQQREASQKNMNFNRYLLVRYLTALFFFSNLNWALSLLVTGSKFFLLPVALILFLVGVIVEQVRVYSVHTNELPFTTKFYWIQLVVNVLLMILSFTAFFPTAFPFLADTQQARLAMSGILLVGCLLCVLVLRRLKNISQDKDRHYQKMKDYEKAMRI